MELNLYKCSDGDNVINKTLTEKLTINITLKRDVNITAPQIILLNDNGAFFNQFNYAEIPELQRFYFIDSVTSLNNRMESLALRCDVLETYKSDVLASNARFLRKLKTGDYINASIDYSLFKTISKHESSKGFDDGSTMIMTTVGGA